MSTGFPLFSFIEQIPFAILMASVSTCVPYVWNAKDRPGFSPARNQEAASPGSAANGRIGVWTYHNKTVEYLQPHL